MGTDWFPEYTAKWRGKKKQNEKKNGGKKQIVFLPVRKERIWKNKWVCSPVQEKYRKDKLDVLKLIVKSILYNFVNILKK